MTNHTGITGLKLHKNSGSQKIFSGKQTASVHHVGRDKWRGDTTEL